MAARVADLLAGWFGCGLFPIAPGTAASAAALVIAWLLVHYQNWSKFYFLAVVLLLLGPAIWAAGRSAARRGAKDPSFVVIDEVLGQWVTLAGAMAWNWKSWLGAFLLFRLLDIWKPQPVRALERLPAGAGIVADDLMAGLYGALVLFVAGWFNLY